MARIEFAKMHGLGNDFVLVNAFGRPLFLDSDRVRALGDRHRGVGFDQLLVAEAPRSPGADVSMAIYNADGSAAGQCGNGLRCFAVYARDQGLVEAETLCIDTPGGRVEAEIRSGEVRVNIGEPRFAPADVPILAVRESAWYEAVAGGERVRFGAVSMGNPHAVLVVDSAAQAPVGRLGPAIQGADLFPRGVNVGFAEAVSAAHIRLRVYERGVGETLACGSGACAAAACGRRQGWLGPAVRVDLPGGTLHIEWAGDGAPLWMTGPTAYAFEGHVEL